MNTYAEMDASGMECNVPQAVCVRFDPWPLSRYDDDTALSEIAAFARALAAAGTCPEVT